MHYGPNTILSSFKQKAKLQECRRQRTRVISEAVNTIYLSNHQQRRTNKHNTNRGKKVGHGSLNTSTLCKTNLGLEIISVKITSSVPHLPPDQLCLFAF